MSNPQRPTDIQAQVLGDIVRLAGGRIRNEHGSWCATALADGARLSIHDGADADIRARSATMKGLMKGDFLVLERETHGEERSSRTGETLYWCGHFRVREDLFVPSAATPAQAADLVRAAEAARTSGKDATAILALEHYARYRADGGAPTSAEFAGGTFGTDDAARVIADGLGAGIAKTLRAACAPRANMGA